MFSSLFLALLVVGATASPTQTKYMPQLSNSIISDLAKMKPNEYQTFDVRSSSGSGLPPDLNGVQRRCRKSHCLLHTFDDGPFNLMRKVVDQAVQGGFKVTFMVNAMNHDCIYNEPRVADLRYALSKGMEFCSHTATHPHLDGLTHAQIDKQIEAVDTALWKILGIVPNCVRPPYGEANSEVVKYINQRHQKVVVNWDLDTGDSMGASVAQSQARLGMIASPESANILMHETIASTPTELFPAAIKIAESHGYHPADMLTVSDGLDYNPYAVKGPLGTRDSSWNCRGLTPLQP